MKVLHFLIVLSYWQLSSARLAPPVHHMISPFVEPCEIRVSGDLGEPQPLILNSRATEFVEPQDASGVIRLNPGEEISLFCTNGFENPSLTGDLVTATCVTGYYFNVQTKSNEMHFYDIFCTSYPYHTARKTERSCANGEATEIEVGFLVRELFLELFLICHDEFTEKTHYVAHSMHPGNDGYQRSFPRPSWLSSGFFNGKNVDRLYTNVNQKAMVAQILGSEELAEQFIQPVDTEIYLARGHLAAKVDFIYGAQQRATFWLMNVAPQWQKFNGGNWERVESSVRRMVSQRNTFLEIYTGTYGIMTLPDMNGADQEIFLHFDENNNGQIPVPKLYYRVLYERSTKRGIVIVGVNNIHITVDEMIEQNYIVCQDVADKIDWINWDRFNVNVGYSYACDYTEFAEIVGHLPHLEVEDLFI